MEKRLVLFVTLSVIIIVAYGGLKLMFAPPPPPPVAENADGDVGAGAEGEDGQEGEDGPEGAAGVDGQPGAPPPGGQAGDNVELPPSPTEEPAETPQAQPPADVTPIARQHLVLGSYAPEAKDKIVAYFDNRGATLERVELVERRHDKLRFRNLEHDDGYLGYLALESVPEGCRVQVIPPGTPAALAKPLNGTTQIGLQLGDIVTSIDDQEVTSPGDLRRYLQNRRPGEEARLNVLRGEGDVRQKLAFQVTLKSHPLELMQKELDETGQSLGSMLVTLRQINDLRYNRSGEMPGLDMYVANWELIENDGESLAFRYQLSADLCKQAGLDGTLAVIKRFQLTRGEDGENPYHVRMSLEVRNDSDKLVDIAFRMLGPNGLPLEGWWYSNKISPGWGGAGARDVVWRLDEGSQKLISASKVYKSSKKDIDEISLLSGDVDSPDHTLQYVGIDTQYFSAVLIPGNLAKPITLQADGAYAVAIGKLEEPRGREIKTQNVTFRLDQRAMQVAAGGTLQQEYVLFLGPKDPQLLPAYRLDQLIEYGWFGWVARRLAWLLHLFHNIVGNFGIAIIMLTVLVRGIMFPLGRKTAKNAQMMQELAPEIKTINEKYAKDLEKRAAATRELWKKHNFHPLGGCWLMFLQLPIFIGLYRCLSVDVELRQASLIPGLSWCSNLAGPDMLWHWESETLAFITGPNGWLGPYLNVLPIITIVLFLLQQKLFTPPATDEQTRMQQKMMKYMMVFFGVLFFKVPSGLCLYFIASSLWGICERKLLPKPTKPKAGAEPEKKEPGFIERIQKMAKQDNGNAATPQERAKARRKRRK